MEIIIREEEARDFDQVRALLQAAFPTASESKLVDALRANGKAILSLVAVQNEQVLGHILFSPVSTTPPTQPKGIGLAPVAVLPTVQSQGIGSQLIREGLRRCQELDYDYCVVLGDPRYYQRFGFQKASQIGLQNEYGADEAFMVTRFSGQRLAPALISYDPEFGMFSL